MKNLTKFTAVLLLIVMAVLVALSGTYAKYTSAIAGEDSATVAKWEIVVVEDDGTTTTLGTSEADFASFDLFSTITEVGGAKETDVKEKTIAPGTQGAFSFTVQNKSEVTAEYGVDYTVENESGVPIEYSIDGGQNWTTELDDVATATLAMNSEPVEVKVMWRWAFEGNLSANYKSTQTNETDTALGLSAPEINVTVKLLVEQVD